MVEIGKLIEFLHESGSSRIVRVLHVDSSGTNCVVIDVDRRIADPEWLKVTDLTCQIEANEARTLEVDHAQPPVRSEEDIPSKERDFRNRAWASICPLVTGDNGFLMLFARERVQLIRKRAKEINVTEKTLHKRVRRFWQGGQIPNTQLSHYRNCGTNKNRQIIKKLGRPRLLAPEEPGGVNVDQNLKRIIVQGGILFYERTKNATYERAYRETLARFCKVGYEVVNGVKRPILPPAGELFSLSQFKYWYQKNAEQRQRRVLISRSGKRRFNLRHRELLGNSTQEAFGPGSLFQVDATLADVYLVSRHNRREIIGRPVIHVIIDVFSRMVVGLSVRPGSEGWLALMLAIENATVDKVAFCEQYAISIQQNDWPVACLPERLLGDRGALESYSADNLANSLGITIENTPPYRGDWKGVVEQFFNGLNIKLNRWVPGAVDHNRERGDRDYRLDAKMDIFEFTQILLKCIIYHNNEHRMEYYDLDEFLIQDDVPPYPIDLFRWGIEKRQGLLRTRDAEVIRVNLLPSDIATVTEHGIRFRRLFYTSDHASHEDWYLKARNSGRWTMRAAYDPRTTNFIFLRPTGGGASIKCQLKSDSPFSDCDWSEVDLYYRLKAISRERARGRTLQADVSLMTEIHHVAAAATKKTASAVSDGLSDTKRLRNIRANAKAEAHAIARAEVVKLYGGKEGKLPSESDEDKNCDYVPIPEPTNVRSISERMMKGVTKEN